MSMVEPAYPRSVPGRGTAFSTLGTPGAALEEVLAEATRTGCRGLELRSATGEVVAPGAAPAGVREALDAAGIQFRVLGGYARLAAPVDEDDVQRAELEGQLHAAASVGATGVRVFMRDEGPPAEREPTSDDTGEGLTAGERRAVERLVAVDPLSRDLGVSVLVELHDSHSSGARLSRVFRTLDRQLPGHTHGIVWDTAHSWAAGESPRETLEAVRSWLAYVQVKDVASRTEPTPVALGSGTYPIAELRVALADGRWHGWVSLEWERRWHADLPPIGEALDRMHDWAGSLWETRPGPDGS